MTVLMEAVMQCLACGADDKMLLMDVVQDDTMNVPVIERRIYMCSACRHIARRLVFRRAKMPITHLPVIATPTRVVAPSVVAPRVWGKAAETQIDLKERAAAAKTATWTKAVERLRSDGRRLRNKQQSQAAQNLPNPCRFLQPLQHSQRL
jgi:hypothetical protein